MASQDLLKLRVGCFSPHSLFSNFVVNWNEYDSSVVIVVFSPPTPAIFYLFWNGLTVGFGKNRMCCVSFEGHQAMSEGF